MKKQLVFLILFFLSFVPFSTGQWTKITQPEILDGGDVNCIGFNSHMSDFFYLGIGKNIATSFDYGETWNVQPIKDSNEEVIEDIIEIKDIHFVSLTTGFLVAKTNSNMFKIFKTFSLGANWIEVYSEAGEPDEDAILTSIDFHDDFNGFCVGTQGKVLKTSDEGMTWTVQYFSPGYIVPVDWTGVKMTDVNNITAVGEDFIMKSTTGGSTWSTEPKWGNYFNAIDFGTSQYGYIAGYDYIYRTTNFGNSWEAIVGNEPGLRIIPQSENFLDISFINDSTGYVVSKHAVFKTTSQGTGYWTKHSFQEEMLSVLFEKNTGIGLVGGKDGTLYISTDTETSFYPLANFYPNPDYSVCSDSLITLNNTSDPNYDFEWLVNGELVSTEYEPEDFSIFQPWGAVFNQEETISLVIKAGDYSDTLNRAIIVRSTLNFPMNIIITDTICKGSAAQIVVKDSHQGIKYIVRGAISGYPLSNEVLGNGNDRTLSVNNITTTTTVRVEGKIEAGCGTVIQDTLIEIYVDNGTIPNNHYFIKDTICGNENSTIVLPTSLPFMTYTLKKEDEIIGEPQVGINDTLFFETDTLINTAEYTINAVSIRGCQMNYSSLELYVEYPDTNFSFENYNPMLSDSIRIIRPHSSNDDIYSWDLGTGALPQQFIADNEPVYKYNSVGLKSVHLIAESPHGCIREGVDTINVINDFVLDTCEVLNIATSKLFPYPIDIDAMTSLVSMKRDKDNYLYTLHRQNDSRDFRMYSNHGDTLKESFPYIYSTGTVYMVITKFTPEGVPMWSTRMFTPDYISGSAIDIDSSGNIFYSGNYGDGGWNVYYFLAYSSDGRLDFRDDNVRNKTFIVKYDKNGYFQNFNKVDGFEGQYVVKVDENQDVFVMTPHKMWKFDNDINLIWDHLHTYRFKDIVVDNEGGVWSPESSKLAINHLNANGNIDYTYPNPKQGFSPSIMRMDDNGNFYIVGHADFPTIPFNFKNEEYTTGICLIKVGADGSEKWIKFLSLDITDGPSRTILGFELYDNTLTFVYEQLSGNVEFEDDGETYAFAGPNMFLFRCDTLGNNVTFEPFYDGSGFTSSRYKGYNNINIFNNGNSMDMAFKFSTDFTTPKGIDIYKYSGSDYDNSAVISGGFDCLYDPLPTTVQPSQCFQPSQTLACIGEPVSFVDLTTNSTSWEWDFSGGIGDETEQNPDVVFEESGNYQVTLIASDGINSQTCYVEIQVQPLPEMEIVASEHFVCPPTETVQLDLYNSTQYTHVSWSTGETSDIIHVEVESDTTITLIGFNACEQMDTATINLFVYPYQEITYSFSFPDTVCWYYDPLEVPEPSVEGGSYTFLGEEIENNQIDLVFNNGGFVSIYAETHANIYFEYTTEDGCVISDHNKIYIDFCPFEPEVEIQGPFCVGDTITFTDPYANLHSSSMWIFSFLDTQQGGIAKKVFDTPGEKTVQHWVQIGGYTSLTAIDTFYIHPKPEVNLEELYPDLFCVGEGTIVFPEGFPEGGVYVIDGDTSEIDSEIFDISYLSAGEYDLEYVYTDQNGCSNSGYSPFEIIDAISSNLELIEPESFCIDEVETELAVPVGSPEGGKLFDKWGNEYTNTTFNPTSYGVGTHYFYYELTGEYEGLSCSMSDTSWFYVYDVPEITLGEFEEETICFNSEPIPLPNATPTGGDFYDMFGQLITTGFFNPNAYPVGPSFIYYEYQENDCTNRDTLTFNIEVCLGIDEHDDLGVIFKTIVPNEVYEIDNISYFNRAVLYDATGRKIKEYGLIPSSPLEVDLKDFGKGIYIIQLYGKDKVTYQKKITKS